MDLKTYLAQKTQDEREAFAALCSTSRGHLQNVMYGIRPCSPELAVLIEKHSHSEVTRQELRADWLAIWPELAPKPAGGSGAANRKQARAG